MLFIVQFEDIYAQQPERLPERAQHMPAHLAFLARHEKQVIAAGALRPAEDAAPVGGIWIVNTPSKEDAEALLQQDPFWIAGLRRSVLVSHWARAFWSPLFVACMEAAGAA
ncbi:MAG: YciI family protein [Janthinobacterium lividum]